MEPTACYFCQNEYARNMNASHWTGTEYIRVDVCKDADCRSLPASAPRKPRVKREAPMTDVGGWAAIEGLNRAMSKKGDKQK